MLYIVLLDKSVQWEGRRVLSQRGVHEAESHPVTWKRDLLPCLAHRKGYVSIVQPQSKVKVIKYMYAQENIVVIKCIQIKKLWVEGHWQVAYMYMYSVYICCSIQQLFGTHDKRSCRRAVYT